MKIGRLIIEKPYKDMESMIGSCGCKFISLPFAYVTWLSSECKCYSCKKFVCECICPLCNIKVIECQCEVF